eukprot:SAG31_NODE_12070_length_971_cov_1.120413_1_plen_198_part_10
MQQSLVVAQPVVVFGIEVSEPGLKSKVQGVVVVSLILALYNVAFGIFTIAGGVGVAYLLCALCVPACGFFGAKQKNRELLCAFWGCNCVTMLCNICTIVMLMLGAGVLHQVNQYGGFDSMKVCCKTLEACNFATTDCQCDVAPGTGFCQGDCPGLTYFSKGNSLCPEPGAKPPSGANVTICIDANGCAGTEAIPKNVM